VKRPVESWRPPLSDGKSQSSLIWLSAKVSNVAVTDNGPSVAPSGTDVQSEAMNMTGEQPTLRRERREAARVTARTAPRKRYDVAENRSRRLRAGAFVMVIAAVLAVGAYLAAGDLLGQRGTASSSRATAVRLSMAGFSPSEIKVKAGETARLELWTTDAAPHLQGGVHTMINADLGIYEELPAAGPTGESRKVVTIQAPATPGTYDIYCDTCCGGKDSPQMHGKLTVEA
jgi:plastocyanin